MLKSWTPSSLKNMLSFFFFLLIWDVNEHHIPFINYYRKYYKHLYIQNLVIINITESLKILICYETKSHIPYTSIQMIIKLLIVQASGSLSTFRLVQFQSFIKLYLQFATIEIMYRHFLKAIHFILCCQSQDNKIK